MKKFVALLLAAMMLLAMVACGNDPSLPLIRSPRLSPLWIPR